MRPSPFRHALPSVAATPCLKGPGPDHVSRLDAMPRVNLLANAACGGLTTTGLAAVAQDPGVAAALSQAESVTLTIGGNDLRLGDLLAACTPAATPTCFAAVGAAEAQLPVVSSNVRQSVEVVAGATGGGAKVLVLGYPRLFAPSGVPGLVDAQTAAIVNGGVDNLNAAIRAGVSGPDNVEFVPVAHRFAGHGLGSADPWIAFEGPGDPDSLHPTSEGYLEGYLPAVRSKVNIGKLGR